MSSNIFRCALWCFDSFVIEKNLWMQFDIASLHHNAPWLTSPVVPCRRVGGQSSTRLQLSHTGLHSLHFFDQPCYGWQVELLCQYVCSFVFLLLRRCKSSTKDIWLLLPVEALSKSSLRVAVASTRPEVAEAAYGFATFHKSGLMRRRFLLVSAVKHLEGHALVLIKRLTQPQGSQLATTASAAHFGSKECGCFQLCREPC